MVHRADALLLQSVMNDVLSGILNFQGDVEKTLGWKPIPLFDRDHAQEVASMQVQHHTTHTRGAILVNG